MKKLIILIFAICVNVNLTYSQSSLSEKILGTWLTQDKDGKILIYKSGNAYFGKLIWGKNLYEADGKTLKKDVKNPDKNLRNRTYLNMNILTNLKFNGEYWENGNVYDPRSGKTYKAEIKLKSDHNLELTGYLGFSFIGKTVVWEKFK